MKRILVIVGLFAALAIGGWFGYRAYLYDKAEQAVMDKDYATAHELLAPLAENNHTLAQELLASLFSAGDGVDRNMETAAHWYEKAADNGDAGSQLWIGSAYSQGYGVVPQDDVKSFHYIRLSAKQGIPESQSWLASMYFIGIGVEANEEEAMKWMSKAVEQGVRPPDWYTNQVSPATTEGPISDACDAAFTGHDAKDASDFEAAFSVCENRALAGDPIIQNRMAIMYGEGVGIEQNEEEALRWLLKAAAQDLPVAQLNLANSYAEGEGTAQDFAEAFRWYVKAAENGVPMAQHILAIYYSDGIGTSRDFDRSLYWIQKAAENDYAKSQYLLSYYYAGGVLGDPDPETAIAWMTKAAGNNLPSAQYDMGQAYLDGNGVEQDSDMAVLWFTQAAGRGYSEAQGKLGLMYMDGQGVERDAEKAIYWSKKAAEQGNPIAQVNLAKLYMRITLESPDEDLDAEAFTWAMKAAKQGQPEAQDLLGVYYWTGSGTAQDNVQAYAWFDQAAKNNIEEAAVSRDDVAKTLSADEFKQAKHQSALLTQE